MDRFRRHPVLTGLLIGIGWGVGMRIWMRYISTDPEFSWSGTMAIIITSGAAGSLMGLARHRRLLGGAGWWRFTGLILILLGAGGAVMWPAVILGAIAWGRRHRIATPLLLLAGLATQWPVIDGEVLTNHQFRWYDKIAATVVYLPMLALEAWAFSVVVAPARVGTPPRLKAALGGALTLLAGMVVVMTGLFSPM